MNFREIKKGNSSHHYWINTIKAFTLAKEIPSKISDLYHKGKSVHEVLEILDNLPKEGVIKIFWIDFQQARRENEFHSWHDLRIFLDKNPQVRWYFDKQL